MDTGAQPAVAPIGSATTVGSPDPGECLEKPKTQLDIELGQTAKRLAVENMKSFSEADISFVKICLLEGMRLQVRLQKSIIPTAGQ